MTEPLVRPMVRADLESVLDLVGRLGAVGHESDPRFELDATWREQMRRFVLDSWLGVFQPFPPCFVAEVDGRLVGLIQGDIAPNQAVVVRPPVVRIGNMWVEPEFRRQGLGRRLVDVYVTAARAKGFPWVEVGTLALDARAVGFWKSVGFGDWRVILLSTPP